MNQDTYDSKSNKFLNSMAEKISYLVREGYTKGQISEYFHRLHGKFLYDGDPGLVKTVTILNDIADRMIDTAIFVHTKNNSHPEIGKFYKKMDDEKNLSYIGKDGRDYYSREALEEANKQYMNQMHTENKPRTM